MYIHIMHYVIDAIDECTRNMKRSKVAMAYQHESRVARLSLWFCIIYYSIHIHTHYILYTIHHTLYTTYYILYTLYYILYTVYCILYTIYYMLYTICYILNTILGPPAHLPAGREESILGAPGKDRPQVA